MSNRYISTSSSFFLRLLFWPLVLFTDGVLEWGFCGNVVNGRKRLQMARDL